MHLNGGAFSVSGSNNSMSKATDLTQQSEQKTVKPKTKFINCRVWVVVTLVLVVVFLLGSQITGKPQHWMLKLPDWTGIGESYEKLLEAQEKTPNGTVTKIITIDKYESAKTLWDWMSLLLAPASLVIFAAWLQGRQEKAKEDRETKEKQEQEVREKVEKERSEDNQREEVLEAYIDRLSVILLDKKLISLKEDSPEEKPIRDVALDVIRARTLSVLRRLDGDHERKASVLLFLYDTELIKSNNLYLDLKNTNLKGAKLQEAILEKAILKGANLENAILKRAYLLEANLENAILVGANLEGAYLEKANLGGANLKGANLVGAYLENAILVGANLEGAYLEKADLVGANLKGAKNLTIEQVKNANNWEKAHYNVDFRKQLGLPPKTRNISNNNP
jgi:hypothetical protein